MYSYTEHKAWDIMHLLHLPMGKDTFKAVVQHIRQSGFDRTEIVGALKIVKVLYQVWNQED